MKKLFTILTVVVLTTTASFGQFSAKAGLNLANMSISGSGSDDSENGMKLGMIIGVSYAMELSDAMSLDIAAAFKQSGSKTSDEQTVGGFTTATESSMSLNYLDISPSLAFNVSDAFSLSFGPYLAFAMSGKTAGEVTLSGFGTGLDGTTETEDDIKFGDGDEDSGIKAMDFGINIGAAYNITDAINVSAGYSLGLSNLNYIDADVDYGDDGEPSLKNNAIYIGVGYTFGG